MNQPQIIHANYIDADTHTQDKYGAWVPARPQPYYHTGLANLLNRLQLAWLVFTGRCDALQWSDNDSANTRDVPTPTLNPKPDNTGNGTAKEILEKLREN